MKTILLILLVSISLNITAQVEKPRTTAKSKISIPTNNKFFNDDPLFRIKFKSEPTRTENEIETDVGIVKMVTYMVEEPTVVYMVAYSTYPSNHISNMNNKTMLDNAVSGFVGNLGMTLNNQNEIFLNNYQGILFSASSDVYYATVADYLVKNTLFQIGIMSSDRFPSQKEVDNFIYSFQLK